MHEDADGRGAGPARRRPGWVTVVAAALVLGGSGTVLAGVIGQDADPPAPSQARSTASTSAPAASSSSAPTASTTTAPPTTSTAASPTPAVEAPQPLPVAVSVPAIGVDSELITVGLGPDGTLEVPEGPDYDKAAWFDGSPRPGALGPAVIEGHVDSAENGPSVFYRLGELAVGDEIGVTRDDGSTVTFRVDDVRRYPKDDFPTLAVYGNTVGPELRLITCGGEFDRGSGHYVDNTVVFATMVAGA